MVVFGNFECKLFVSCTFFLNLMYPSLVVSYLRRYMVYDSFQLSISTIFLVLAEKQIPIVFLLMVCQCSREGIVDFVSHQKET